MLALSDDEHAEQGKTGMFDSLIAQVTSTEADAEPVLYQAYSAFEVAVVKFMHTSNVVLCFETLLLQLMESQIKQNRVSKETIKPHFFSAFVFAEYSKPQQAEKLAL